METKDMTVLHTGSTKKFAEGWQAIFSKSSGKKKSAAGNKASASAKGKKKAASAKKKPAARK
jgi:hypothetical protein